MEKLNVTLLAPALLVKIGEKEYQISFDEELGTGRVLDGNRKQRRHNLIPMHYIPCPDCSGKK